MTGDLTGRILDIAYLSTLKGISLKQNPTIFYYDLCHELYDAETRDFWFKFPPEVIDAFVSNLHGTSVLDVGSGPGRDAIMLRDRGLDVICADASEKMVEDTAKLGFESIQCDMRDMPFLQDTFHGVWAYSSLLHLPFGEASAAIAGISRILKPAGILLLGLIEGKGQEIRKSGSNGLVRYFEFYDDEKLSSLVAGTGLVLFSKYRFQPKNDVYVNYILKKIPLGLE